MANRLGFRVALLEALERRSNDATDDAEMIAFAATVSDEELRLIAASGEARPLTAPGQSPKRERLSAAVPDVAFWRIVRPAVEALRRRGGSAVL